MSAVFLGIFARHALTALGAYLLTKGFDASAVEAISGALTTLGGVAWSIWQKKNSGVL